jgi:isoleucyl-tRNA synthetase
VAPQEIIQRSGAEILRLWVAMVDYREEVRLGPEILARVIEAYRKLRNTCRYLVANLYDFDPRRDAVAPGHLEEVDRYALARYAETASFVLECYGAGRTTTRPYDFPAIFQALNALLTVDLSAFYFDVSKDRLYTFGAGSEARRSAQTAMYVMADGLARLLAPLLPVTADELWRFLPGEREPSVHLVEFPVVADLNTWLDRDDGLVERWDRLIRLREAVNAQLEKLRQQKVIGTSLEAAVELRGRGALGELIARHGDDLPPLFIASEVVLAQEPLGSDGNGALVAAYDESEGSGVEMRVRRAGGTRCARCWRYVARVSDSPETAGICGRCADALAPAADQAERTTG